jgi:hypothetical protein
LFDFELDLAVLGKRLEAFPGDCGMVDENVA